MDGLNQWLAFLQTGGLPASLLVFILGLLRGWWVLGINHSSLIARLEASIERRNQAILQRDEAIASRDRRITELTTIAVQHAATIDRAVTVVERSRS